MLTEGGVGLDNRQADKDQIAGHDASEHAAQPEEGAHIQHPVAIVRGSRRALQARLAGAG